MPKSLRIHDLWFEYLKLTRSLLYPEPEYLNQKFRDHVLFIKVSLILINIATTFYWFWDFAIDPIGALSTFWFRLYYIANAVILLLSFNYVKTESGLFFLAVPMLAVIEIVFIMILRSLENGMMFGVCAFLSFYIISFIVLQGLSCRHMLICIAVAIITPHLTALAGFAPGFPHLVYAMMIWPSAIISAVTHIAMDINYRKCYLTEKQLDCLSKTDSLTGLNNRGHAIVCLQNELQRCQRFKHPLSFLTIDIDFFKRINDTYGHLAGDVVLIYVSNLFKSLIRSIDIPSRLGGEEFGIILPECSREHAIIIAERIRAAVESSAVPTDAGTIHFTCSIGIATTQDMDTVESIMTSADKALYRAKNEGRNRVSCKP